MSFKIASMPDGEWQQNSEESIFEILLYSQNTVMNLLLLLSGSTKEIHFQSHPSIWTLETGVQTQLPERASS